MSLLRLLRERWAWWLIPLLVTLGVATYFAMTRPAREPAMPLQYDLPTDP